MGGKERVMSPSALGEFKCEMQVYTHSVITFRLFCPCAAFALQEEFRRDSETSEIRNEELKMLLG